MNTQKLRIHGDNILECEHAMYLIAEALSCDAKKVEFVGGSAYSPMYRISSNNSNFEIQLFPGYGRWKFDITKFLMDRGAVLREATDAIITKLVVKDGQLYEDPVLSMEFCGALPAGNNAWQRCGRAVASAYAKIPYLYYAELGGLELGTDRKEKASRYPNPLIPFAYLSLGQVEKSVAIPVYIPSPSAKSDTYSLFEECFGYNDALLLIKNLILGESAEIPVKSLEEKAEKVVEILASQRKRNDVLSPEKFKVFKNKITGLDKANWLSTEKMPWNKKTGLKTLTKSFQSLLSVTQKCAVAVGSKDMPICLIPAHDRKEYGNKIREIYGKEVDDKFVKWIENSDSPLVCIWVAGFKPRGDDSRPDRGLVPLGRMIFGKDEVDIMSIVYGPAKPSAWAKLDSDIDSLSKTNGLWEAILGLSNALIVDSPTSKSLKSHGYLLKKEIGISTNMLLRASGDVPLFGEHDVDSTLHLLFSNKFQNGVYEGLCNPPGGDWSGISVCDFKTKNEYRWSSLPRVSGEDTKRPDHLIQFENSSLLLAIESKDSLSSLEDNIGPRLNEYIERLIKINPNSTKTGIEKWASFSDDFSHQLKIISGAAFRTTDVNDLVKAQKKGNLDIVFGIDFKETDLSKMLILIGPEAELIRNDIMFMAEKYKSVLNIEFVSNNLGKEIPKQPQPLYSAPY